MGLVEDVQSYLEDQGLTDDDWPSAWLRHDESDQLVLITADGGPQMEVPAAEGLGSAALMRPAVLVTVRGEHRDAYAPYEKILAIRDALHGLTDVTMGSTRYMLVRARVPEPAGPMLDDSGRPEYTMSFIATADAV